MKFWKTFGGDMIQAGANVLGNVLTSRARRRNIERTNRANLELAKYAHQKDVEMWERMQEYNSPAQQMARFREAGLNPNLVYGQGTPGNVDGAPSFNAPRMDFTGRPPAMDIGAAVSGFHQGVMQSNDRSIAEQKVIQEEIKSKADDWSRKIRRLDFFDAHRANALASILHADLTATSNIADTAKRLKENWVSKMSAQEVNNTRTALMNEYQKEVNRLAKQNMTIGDHWQLRLGEAILRSLGVPADWIQNVLR